MPKVAVSLERGSFFRVILGMIMTAIFVISIMLHPEEYMKYVFWVILGLALTWQNYSLYLIKKQEKQDDSH